VRDVSGLVSLPAFVGRPFDSRALAEPSLELTRGGELNYGSGAQSDSAARRLSPQGRAPRAPHLAGARSRPVSVPLEAPLLADVETFELRFLGATGDPVDTWPTATSGLDVPPRAMEVTLAVKGVGRFKRLFLVNQLMLPARTQRGIALVTAMMIVAIAAAIAAQIAFAHQIWFRQMENIADRDATDWLRRGALHWASLALLEDAGAELDRPSRGELGDGIADLPVEGGAIKVSIEDAQARFN